ncbi:MAG: DUF192 domain-containing protein [Alphaproteobacteria bacterium]
MPYLGGHALPAAFHRLRDLPARGDSYMPSLAVRPMAAKRRGRPAVPLALAVLFLAVVCGGTPAQAAGHVAMETSELTIESAAGRHRFQVELATTPEQRAWGLMFREALAPDAGMLFDYAGERPAGMWMKNTLIPLDMLFIDGGGRIVNIVERAVPGSLEIIPSAGPVKGVLELNGGTAARLGIMPGDRVVHPMFQAAP